MQIKTILLAATCFTLAQMPARAQVNHPQAFPMVAAPQAQIPQPAQPAVRAVRPIRALNAPVTQMLPRVNQPTAPVIQQTAQHAVPPAPQPPAHIDFNQILGSDDTQCVPCNQGCDSAVPCKDDSCCLEKAIYGDFENSAICAREDILPVQSPEGTYQTPPKFRGFWSDYPEEKRRERMKIQSLLCEPDPAKCEATCTGPILHAPRDHCAPKSCADSHCATKPTNPLK